MSMWCAHFQGVINCTLATSEEMINCTIAISQEVIHCTSALSISVLGSHALRRKFIYCPKPFMKIHRRIALTASLLIKFPALMLQFYSVVLGTVLVTHIMFDFWLSKELVKFYQIFFTFLSESTKEINDRWMSVN